MTETLLADCFDMCSSIAGILDSCPVVNSKDAGTQNQLHNYLKSASWLWK